MELRLTLFEKMSALRRAQIATRWTMRSGTRCLKTTSIINRLTQTIVGRLIYLLTYD